MAEKGSCEEKQQEEECPELEETHQVTDCSQGRVVTSSGKLRPLTALSTESGYHEDTWEKEQPFQVGIIILCFVCACVCVCVRAHAHAHAHMWHTHTRNTHLYLYYHSQNWLHGLHLGASQQKADYITYVGGTCWQVDSSTTTLMEELLGCHQMHIHTLR